MMKSNIVRYFIGIDPDVEASGFAVWDVKDRKFISIQKLGFWPLISELEAHVFKWMTEEAATAIVIEAGWLIKKSNWHGGHYSKTAGERIAKNVGANHQVGKLIVEYCQKVGLRYTEVKPSGKIKAEPFKKLTGYSKRLNQDCRDAAMLVYGL